MAYGYYILLGLAFTLMAFVLWRAFNYEGFFVAVIFGVQVYFKHRLMNLLLGIPILALSIYWALEFMLMGGKTGFDFFVDAMMGLSVTSIIMSVILIFGYTKLSFKDQ